MFSPLRDFPVLDAHIHFGHPDLASNLISNLDGKKIGKFNLVCTPHPNRLSLVPEALHLKAHYPERVYVFGGLDILPLFLAPETCGEHFAAYVDTLVEMGCDGVKMLEGKPDIRKRLPIPAFDSPPYEPYWQKMEASGLPIIFHVNDPQEFWDAEKVPDWARQQGWFYGDGSYINNEVQYAQVLHVLERHPRLKVVFAHFFFFSAQLDRLGRYMDQFPDLHVDLTPGIEMYQNFSQNPDLVRQFFLKYQDRILYGTDIGAISILSSPSVEVERQDSNIRVELVRRFLELEGEFTLGIEQSFLFGRFDRAFQGLGLPVEALEKIYHKNFERLAGEKPRSLNPQAIVAECERLISVIPFVGAALPSEKTDTSVAESVRTFFSKESEK